MSQRLSNWEAAQLSEQQLQYAALDAWAATLVYDALRRKLTSVSEALEQRTKSLVFDIDPAPDPAWNCAQA